MPAILARGKKNGIEFNRAGYCFLVTGGGCLIKRQVFESIGFFDENYFAYMEDVDFCLRAQMRGFRGWYEPGAVIRHVHKATSSRDIPFTEYLQFRNMTQTIIRDFPSKLLFRNFNLLLIILVNLNTVLYFFKNGFWKEALKAEAFILLNFGRLISERRKIQSAITVSEEYLIENFRPKRITFYGLLKK